MLLSEVGFTSHPFIHFVVFLRVDSNVARIQKMHSDESALFDKLCIRKLTIDDAEKIKKAIEKTGVKTTGPGLETSKNTITWTVDRYRLLQKIDSWDFAETLQKLLPPFYVVYPTY